MTPQEFVDAVTMAVVPGRRPLVSSLVSGTGSPDRTVTWAMDPGDGTRAGGSFRASWRTGVAALLDAQVLGALAPEGYADALSALSALSLLGGQLLAGPDIVAEAVTQAMLAGPASVLPPVTAVACDALAGSRVIVAVSESPVMTVCTVDDTGPFSVGVRDAPGVILASGVVA